MPHCIFCDTRVPHTVAGDRSVCLNCLIELRRFEFEHAPEVMQRVLPQRVLDALRRLRDIDPDQVKDDATRQQMRRDLQIVQEVIPY